jgi:hypothetical protein
MERFGAKNLTVQVFVVIYDQYRILWSYLNANS